MVYTVGKFITFALVLAIITLFLTQLTFSDSGAEYTIIKTSAPPKIDGKLDDAIWKATEPAEIGLINALGVECQKKSLVYAVYDDTNFYVAFHRIDKDIKKLVANVEDNDGNVWEDDEVELFIDVDHDHATYWQIAVNPNNALWDCYNPGGGCAGADNIKCDTAVSVGAKEDWFAEIKISLKDLDVKETPKAGAIWGINFAGHVMSGIDEWVTWSDIGASFHTPAGFGNGIFSIKLAAVNPSDKLPFLWGYIKSY